jgi:Protein kinase domain
LYSLAPLQAILPPVHCLQDNADGSIKDARGQPLPPFVVIEKGEALNEWAKRRAPDFPTSLTVLCHVAERLQALHEAGLAHRDLKPENILWLPSRNEWTLIDFGCAAPIGEAASLSYSIRCVLVVTTWWLNMHHQHALCTPSSYRLVCLSRLPQPGDAAPPIAIARDCMYVCSCGCSNVET